MTEVDLTRRSRIVAIVKAGLALLFLLVVAFTLPHPVSIAVGVLDLLLVLVYALLARRFPRAATYALIVETALALTPRQFVQGYVNGVNWPIYIVLPLIAAYVMRERRAVLVSAVLTALIAVPVMLAAAFTLPPGMRPGDVLTLVVFVTGLMLGAAFAMGDIWRRSAVSNE
jgi:hypothetical protein